MFIQFQGQITGYKVFRILSQGRRDTRKSYAWRACDSVRDQEKINFLKVKSY